MKILLTETNKMLKISAKNDKVAKPIYRSLRSDSKSRDVSERLSLRSSYSNKTPIIINQINKKNNTYSTGRSLLQNGNVFPLLFKIDIVDDDRNNTRIVVRIPVPAGYETSIYRYKKYGLALLNIAYNRIENRLSIDWFYVYPNVINEATENEKKVCKGIGKTMLCFGIQYLLFKHLNLKWSNLINSSAVLIAKGGDICKAIPKINQEYSFTELSNYLSKFSDVRRYIKLENKEILSELMCMIKHNKKLAKFYGSLGFKFINNDNKLKLEDVNKETSEKNLHILLEILSGPRRTVTQPTYHIEVMYYMKTYIIHLLRNCNVTINYLE